MSGDNDNDPPQMIDGLPVIEVGHDFMAGLLLLAEREKDAITLRDVALDLAEFDAGRALDALRRAVELVTDDDLEARAERILGPRRSTPSISPTPEVA